MRLHPRWFIPISALVLFHAGAARCDQEPVPPSAAADAKTPADSKPADDKSGTFEIDVGPDVDTGKYGTRRRATVSSLDTLVDWDPFETTTLSLSLPYLVQRAPAGTIAGHSSAKHVHVGAGPEVTNDGIGDLVLGIDQYLLEQGDQQPIALGLNGEVKFGTASISKGLGSGENDYTGEFHVAHTFNKATAEIRAGYSILGSPGQVTVNGISEDVRYRDIWLGSLLGAYQLSDALSVGGAFDSERSSERHQPPADDFTANASYQIRSHLSLKAMILKGLTNSSPDWSGSLLVSLDL